MDISKITDVKELKAMAFDEMKRAEQAQANLAMIVQRIDQLEETPSADNKEE